VRRLIAFPAGMPALRMPVDKMAEALAGMSHALNGRDPHSAAVRGIFFISAYLRLKSEAGTIG
jgi:hypothetical protein